MLVARDPALRPYYLAGFPAAISRLLGAIDRNPYSPTYGCLDRQFWHYRTASFPSEMYQEGVLPLALAYAHALPGNRWRGNPRVKELAEAGIRFAARSSHGDGSCDDYYPFERALGAAVFSLLAAVRAYQVLRLDDAELVQWFRRRARWLVLHGESGRLTNHHAAAALGLLHVAEITGDDAFRRAADARIDRVLAWQDEEGWFEEYGGADPGYQTVTIDGLAQYRKASGDARLDQPLERAAEFARQFLHPDESYGGQYGSRGTHHFYPHGMELLAPRSAAAADLADGFLRSVAAGTEAHFGDDRLFTHRLASRIEAWLDWSADRAAASPPDRPSIRYFCRAQILVRRDGTTQTVVSAARGGVFEHFSAGARPVSDAGLIVETEDGRVAASQWHDRSRQAEYHEFAEVPDGPASCPALRVTGPLYWCRFETATPVKQALFHTAMCLAGRWFRGLVRGWLQGRLITGRRECPIRLTRRFEFVGPSPGSGPLLRVTDTIELTGHGVRLRRMAFGADHQTAYVAACGVYQEAVLAPWADLSDRIDELNARRCATIVREFPA